ncbi:hypothetical protein PVT67_07685 [Gallaecimonas kandeliae]|uniref:hypothetical protein n=1 Tax=Gallaecimonas kandeliae TaxID=3029055 RepID=UPI0026471BA5|nr:hypothetical protein [Gallaecimonas kandeliae]WKE67106.1 hypothetical protein PVT67_07685 [Gallaecimonas kandeliae]
MRIASGFTAFITLIATGCAIANTSSAPVTSEKPSLTVSQEETWNLMIGKWYGSQPTKDGGKKQEIVERFPQGTYKTIFRIHDKDGKIKEQTEAGQWGVSGPVYFTIFRGFVEGNKFFPSNPAEPYNYDAYKIIKLDKKVFEYENYSSGNKYTTERVSNDFQFPNE